MKKIEAEVDTTWKDFFCRCTIFRLAKPAFFRYNEHFTLVRDFHVAYFAIPEISKIIDRLTEDKYKVKKDYMIT